MRIIRTIGNKSLWQREKTLFLTSRMAPLACYESIFRWVESFDRWQCAVCFNTSELEEEVLKALLVCRVPTTLVVTGGFKDTYNVQIEQALKEKRLLILVLQREDSDGKGFIARLRNQWAIDQVQHIVCGYINPNGSIFGLLAGHNNVTHLLDKADLKAAEAIEKPYRWTVAEDKRLRMYYEDMGIHAIHKAINRPYSTIYNRVKALTMNDELLKGREFEDYVLELLDIAHSDKLTLKEWRGDKSLPGIYPESNSAPDFVFEYDGQPFAVECKWRSHLPKDLEKELLPSDRMASFQQFSTDRQIPVYLLLGIGGLPNDPECLYFTRLDKDFSLETLLNNDIPSKECLLEKISGLFLTDKHSNQHMEEQKAVYPNAYKPWSEDDDAILTKLYKEGTSIKELMSLFQRNRGGIASRLRKLGLT